MASYWNPDMEKLDQKSIAELQGRKLRAMVRDRLFRHHPYYSPLLKSSGFDVHDITGIEDLSRLPFTSHEDLASDPESFILSAGEKALAGRRPLASRLQSLVFDAVGGNSRVRQIDDHYPVTIFETAGGVPVYLSKYDLEIFKELCGRAAMCMGLGQTDRYQNTHPYGQRLDFWHSHHMALIMRMFASGMGQAGPTEELRIANKLSATVIAGDPYYLYFVAKAAAKAGADLSKLRVVLLSGSAADAQLKIGLTALLEKAGAYPSVVESYTVPESKQSLPGCPGGQGFHTYPDVHIWECVDPDTGEPVNPGDPGELVFTNIDGRGTTLLRYRTGDIAEGGIVYEACETCGRTVPRVIGPIRKKNGEHEAAIINKLLDADGIYYATYTGKAGVRLYLDGTVPGARVLDTAIKACGQSRALIKLDHTYVDL